MMERVYFWRWSDMMAAIAGTALLIHGYYQTNLVWLVVGPVVLAFALIPRGCTDRSSLGSWQ